MTSLSLLPHLSPLNTIGLPVYVSQTKRSAPVEEFVSVRKSDLDRILELLARLVNGNAKGAST